MTDRLHLVIGGTGAVGQHVARGLRDSGASVRMLVRDRTKTESLFGDSVEIVVGDLSDSATLAPAFQDVAKVFVLAPPTPDIVANEAAAFDAAVATGVQHAVNLSNFGAGNVGRSDSIWGAPRRKRSSSPSVRPRMDHPPARPLYARHTV
jgi:uncharacterized protein YbjT (DUF2867 family)